MSATSLVAWATQTFLIAAICSNLFVYALLYASTAAVLQPILVTALASIALIVGMSSYVVFLVNDALEDARAPR